MLLAALGASAWLATGGLRARADWVEVEAPALALPDRPLPLRIAVRAPAPGLQVSVDLHRLGARREPHGFLSAGGSQPIPPDARPLLFAPRVPAGAGPGSVIAVIHLSPTGRWEDHGAVATTAPIPVRAVGDPGALAPLPAYDGASALVPRAPASPLLRGVIAALWLASAVLVWRRRRPRLVLACAAAGLWELADAERALAAAGRALARAQGLYFERHALQEGAALALLLGAAALAAMRLRGARGRATDPVSAACWLYAGVALLSALSWHEADRLLAAPLLSFPAAQVAKLALAAAALLLAGRQRG